MSTTAVSRYQNSPGKQVSKRATSVPDSFPRSTHLLLNHNPKPTQSSKGAGVQGLERETAWKRSEYYNLGLGLGYTTTHVGWIDRESPSSTS